MSFQKKERLTLATVNAAKAQGIDICIECGRVISVGDSGHSQECGTQHPRPPFVVGAKIPSLQEQHSQRNK